MHHFFVEEHQISGDSIWIAGEDAHHMRNVLRIRPGEEVSVFVSGEGREYRAVLGDYTDEEAHLDVIFVKEKDVELPIQVTLYQGLPKGDKLELIIQKSVELGVSRIVPVACTRSISRIDEKKVSRKTERWNAIAEGAAKQSQRAMIPEVSPPLSMKEALREAAGQDRIFIPYEKAEDMGTTRRLVGEISKGESIAVFIGPEGGFTKEEIRMAQEAGACAITMGRRILRTETAGMAFLAWMVYLTEE